MQIRRFILFTALICFNVYAKEKAWQPAEGMLTPWGEALSPETVLQDHPRPTLQRPAWENLNGLWDYQITHRNAALPKKWHKRGILVPFGIESPLSGIGQRLNDNQELWYRKSFKSAPAPGEKTLLHFGAVDYRMRAWVNGQMVGSHIGGNLPFSFDITQALRTSGENELIVRVEDDTDHAGRFQLRGKQKRDNQGIWYSPVTGIWQTVWLEQVPEQYIQSVKISGDMTGRVDIAIATNQATYPFDKIRVSAFDKKQRVASAHRIGNQAILRIPKPKLWSPKTPFLYDLKIEILDKKGNILDTISSYVGLRTVGRQQDKNGHWRFTLNGETIFHWGPLDQGWWPDGYLTPPSEDALIYEINYLKQSGFNMIRKHKKVEPSRYYYLCDKLGMLVWQDQVSGGSGGRGNLQEWPFWHRLTARMGAKKSEAAKVLSSATPKDADWPQWAHDQYMVELQSMIDTLYTHPSIVVWTTFNERWGQHNSEKVGAWVERYDPTRSLNIASGGNFFPVGDIADAHSYPHPKFPFSHTEFDDYVKVVGEFGGHGWAVEGHTWQTTNKKAKSFMYGDAPKSVDEMADRIKKSIEILGSLKKKGVAAGVYTQTTDVEVEINGLITYDRKIEKISPKVLKQFADKAGLIN